VQYPSYNNAGNVEVPAAKSCQEIQIAQTSFSGKPYQGKQALLVFSHYKAGENT